MEHSERLEIVRLAAKYHETLGRIQTAGQLDAVLRLGRDLATALPADQAALFGHLVTARAPAARAPGTRAPAPGTRAPAARIPRPRTGDAPR